MAATARAGKRKYPTHPGPDGDEVISIGVPPEDQQAPEPERVPIFEIAGTLYTMLKEPPPTLGIASLAVADRKGGNGFGEVYLLREMMGSDALNALIDAGKKGWLKKSQYDAITRRVTAAALGVAEEDLPNP
jgi:hypothetical protein